MNGLELQSVGIRYKGQQVLDDISVAVPKGSTLVLFGPSGGGKSVLLRLIAGVIDPDAGDIRIDGKSVNGVDPEDRGIGMAFQNFALFPHMSAQQNIASSLEVIEPSRSKLEAAVDRVARLLKIDHVLDHKPRALSNGQKQRTALARALVGSPTLLLLDDPLRNVDAKLRFEMRLELPALLAEQGTTVVYVTQDYKEAMALGEQIAVIVGGRIRQIGSPADIYHEPASIDIARQFGDPVINLLDVVPARDDAGVFVRVSDRRIPLGPMVRDVVGSECVLGIRAESLRFVDSSDSTGFPVTIEAVTPLNEKVVTLTSTLRGREILLSRPADVPGPASGEAFIAVDPGGVHLFDRGSGERLNRPLGANVTEAVA